MENYMNKKLAKWVLLILILIIGYFLVNYLMFKAGEYLFKTEIINAEEVKGQTDNNDYGIRNDVYDVIQKEYIEKMNLNEEEKIILYNFAYIKQKTLENFFNESSVIKYKELFNFMLDCHYEKHKNLINKIVEYKGEYYTTVLNTKERKMANLVTERISIKNNNKIKEFVENRKDCVKFNSLLKD